MRDGLHEIVIALALVCVWSQVAAAQLCPFRMDRVPATSRPQQLISADFDGDGHADLAMANSLYTNPAQVGLSVLAGNGDGTFHSSFFANLPGFPRAVIAADVNADGVLDLITGEQNILLGLGVWIGNGDGPFQPITRYPTSTGYHQLAAADFDGDSYTDIVVTGMDDSSVTVRRNAGDGTFDDTLAHLTVRIPQSVEAADLDHDGDIDLVVPGALVISRLLVFLNDGTGSFGGPADYGAGTSPSETAIADLDGDTWVDLAVADFADQVHVLKNQGNGTFAAAGTFPTDMRPEDIIAADLDFDGDADLATANFDGMGTSILLNDGTGAFGAPLNIPTGGRAASLCSADFNGDSFADLAVANLDSNRVALLLQWCDPFPGDLNCDVCLDISDVVMLGNILDGLLDLSGTCGGAAADFDGDNDVDEHDYQGLFDAVAGSAP
jgi:hypothetical protein